MARANKEPRDLCDILDEMLETFQAAAEEAETAREEEELAEKQKQYEEAAINIRMMYDSLMDVDFNEGQAFKLLTMMLGGVTK